MASKRIHSNGLFNGRLDKYGINEEVTWRTTAHLRILSDEELNLLSVNINEDGSVNCFQVGKATSITPWIILDAIAAEFDCDIHLDIN
jgi:hypothetical protein